jgi:hypothetical protein
MVCACTYTSVMRIKIFENTFDTQGVIALGSSVPHMAIGMKEKHVLPSILGRTPSKQGLWLVVASYQNLTTKPHKDRIEATN